MYFEFPNTKVRVLGSLHMVPAGSDEVPTWARSAYDWCETMVVEHDPPSLLPLFKSNSSRPSRLQPHILAALEQFWPGQGPLSPLRELRPWAALIGLAVLNQQTVNGIEPNFLRWAAEHAKPVRYLETASDVVRSFDSAPLEDIEASIEMALPDLPLMQRRLIEMHSAWLSRDRERLLSVAASAPLFSFPSLRQAVLENRNRAWAPVVDRMLQTSERTLVVVGALHLCGAGSLEQYLGRELLPIRSVA